MPDVSVLSYGVGNIGSVMNMYRRLGVSCDTVSTPQEVRNASRVLLPGVGAFDRGMSALTQHGLTDAIREHATAERPLLGICLGMQLLLDHSEEGSASGLGLIPGGSRRFPATPGLRVPHMGWNEVTPTEPGGLFAGLEDENRFYFVHSYYVAPEHDEHVIGRTPYGTPFASSIRSGNVLGAQFHPEKSHAFGMRLLKNFASL